MLGLIDFLLNPAANLIGKSVKNAFRWMIKFLLTALVNMIRRIIEAFVDFLSTSSAVSFSSGWWTNATTNALFATMVRIGTILVLVLLVAAIVDGIVHSNVGLMVRTIQIGRAHV